MLFLAKNAFASVYVVQRINIKTSIYRFGITSNMSFTIFGSHVAAYYMNSIPIISGVDKSEANFNCIFGQLISKFGGTTTKLLPFTLDITTPLS